MWSVSFKPPALVGIAILPGKIHLIQMIKTKKRYQVERVRAYALTAEIYSEGKITGFGVLESALKDIVRAEDLYGARAALCVPANQVRMQRITVPCGLSEKDIAAEISIHVHRKLPAKLEDLAFDYHVYPAAEPQEMEVFFTATRKDYILQLKHCCEAAGMAAAIMDVDVLALLRAIRYALRRFITQDQTTCVLYCIEDYALIVAARKDQIVFCQQWHGGGAIPTVTFTEWLERVCHAWRHVSLEGAAIGGLHAYVYEAAVILARQWQCRIFEPDPFAEMVVISGKDKSVISDNPSAFLLACGLAMREARAW